MGVRRPVVYPPIPRIAFPEQVSAHPVVYGLADAQFPFTAPVETTDRFRELDGVCADTRVRAGQHCDPHAGLRERHAGAIRPATRRAIELPLGAAAPRSSSERA